MSLICSQYNFHFVNTTSFKAINYTCSWTNITLAVPTIILNVSLIITLATSGNKSKPCTILLLNLAITDLVTGLVNMPILFVIYRYIAEGNVICSFLRIATPLILYSVAESFMTVTLIAIERYINVFHPYFHASKLPTQNVIVCIAVSWLLSLVLITPLLAGVESAKLSLLIFAIIAVGISLNIYCYLRVLCRARKVGRQIQHEAARFGQVTITSTDKRYIAIGALIILSMILCYTPEASLSILRVSGYRDHGLQFTHCWERTLTMVNSLINPFITFSFCPIVRRKVLKILTCRVFRQVTNEPF